MIICRTLKTLLAACLISLVAGCKIAVMVVEGGAVETGDWFDPASCAEGAICIHPVNNTNYSETFSAIPNPGWRFVKWNAGDDFLCADSTSPICAVTNIDLAGNPVIEAVVASPKTFYLMPLFLPLTEIDKTVTMNGKEWAPLNSFGNLSWDEIDAVCPATNGGHCLVGAKLMEYDMTGWTWASVDDVNALFNAYLGSGAMGPGPDELASAGMGLQFTQVLKFPATSSAQVCGGCREATWKGWTSTGSGVAGEAHLAEVYLALAAPVGYIGGHSTTLLTDAHAAGHSAWFYRTP
jgi:hypothetical protein